jgi:hypothetical protein
MSKLHHSQGTQGFFRGTRVDFTLFARKKYEDANGVKTVGERKQFAKRTIGSSLVHDASENEALLDEPVTASRTRGGRTQ